MSFGSEVLSILRILHLFAVLVIAVFSVIQSIVSITCSVKGINSNGDVETTNLNNLVVFNASDYGFLIIANDSILTKSGQCDLLVIGNIFQHPLNHSRGQRTGGASYSFHDRIKTGGSISLNCLPSLLNSGPINYDFNDKTYSGLPGNLNDDTEGKKCSMSCVTNVPTHTCNLTDTQFEIYYSIFVAVMITVLTLSIISSFVNIKNHFVRRKFKSTLEWFGVNTRGLIDFCNPIDRNFHVYKRGEYAFFFGYFTNLSGQKTDKFISEDLKIFCNPENNSVDFYFESKKGTTFKRIELEATQIECLQFYLWDLGKSVKNYILEFPNERNKSYSHHPKVEDFIRHLEEGLYINTIMLSEDTISTSSFSLINMDLEEIKKICWITEFINFRKQNSEFKKIFLCLAIHNYLFFNKVGNISAYCNSIKNKTFYNNRPSNCGNSQWKLYTSDLRHIKLNDDLKIKKFRPNYCSNEYKMSKAAQDSVNFVVNNKKCVEEFEELYCNNLNVLNKETAESSFLKNINNAKEIKEDLIQCHLDDKKEMTSIMENYEDEAYNFFNQCKSSGEKFSRTVPQIEKDIDLINLTLSKDKIFKRREKNFKVTGEVTKIDEDDKDFNYFKEKMWDSISENKIKSFKDVLTTEFPLDKEKIIKRTYINAVFKNLSSKEKKERDLSTDKMKNFYYSKISNPSKVYRKINALDSSVEKLERSLLKISNRFEPLNNISLSGVLERIDLKATKKSQKKNKKMGKNSSFVQIISEKCQWIKKNKMFKVNSIPFLKESLEKKINISPKCGKNYIVKDKKISKGVADSETNFLTKKIYPILKQKCKIKGVEVKSRKSILDSLECLQLEGKVEIPESSFMHEYIVMFGMLKKIVESNKKAVKMYRTDCLLL